MSVDLACRKCGNDLEAWNTERSALIRYCPGCGTRLRKPQIDLLWRKITIAEVSDEIRDRLLEVLSQDDIIENTEGELPQLAWEGEVCNGVVFCDNYRAGLFAARHRAWAYAALNHACEDIGEFGYWLEQHAYSVDKFLVSAFCWATEHYVYDQLGVRAIGERLTRRRVREIKRLAKATEYDGEF
jgi:hypothetical protein